MFNKILKHDIRSIARFWWIIAISTLGISVLGGLALRLVFEMSELGLESIFLITVATIFSSLFSMLSIFGILASMSVTLILVYLRFYKNFFTDEGYLTFTLPVSRRQLLLSKTLSAFIWLSAHTVLIALCFFVFVIIASPASGNYFINVDMLSGIPDLFCAIWEETGVWTLVYLLEVLIMLMLSILFAINIAQMCITIGAVVAKKHKLLAAIGIYYGLNVVISSILPTVFYIFLFSFAESIFEALANAPEQVICTVIALVMFVVCALMAAAVFLVYTITRNCLERRLDLT
jgi:hypothetical protein